MNKVGPFSSIKQFHIKQIDEIFYFKDIVRRILYIISVCLVHWKSKLLEHKSLRNCCLALKNVSKLSS